MIMKPTLRLFIVILAGMAAHGVSEQVAAPSIVPADIAPAPKEPVSPKAAPMPPTIVRPSKEVVAAAKTNPPSLARSAPRNNSDNKKMTMMMNTVGGVVSQQVVSSRQCLLMIAKECTCLSLTFPFVENEKKCVAKTIATSCSLSGNALQAVAEQFARLCALGHDDTDSGGDDGVNENRSDNGGDGGRKLRMNMKMAKRMSTTRLKAPHVAMVDRKGDTAAANVTKGSA